jgi:hypothetical protein
VKLVPEHELKLKILPKVNLMLEKEKERLEREKVLAAAKEAKE